MFFGYQSVFSFVVLKFGSGISLILVLFMCIFRFVFMKVDFKWFIFEKFLFFIVCVCVLNSCVLKIERFMLGF